MTNLLLGGDIMAKKKQLKSVDPNLPFPSLLSDSASFKLTHIKTSFPTRTSFVPCTYDDTPFVTHKVHMKNSGSCVVPKGRTITLHEWKRQNGIA